MKISDMEINKVWETALKKIRSYKLPRAPPNIIKNEYFLRPSLFKVIKKIIKITIAIKIVKMLYI